MLLYCDKVYAISEEEYQLLYQLLPLSRREKIDRYRKKEDKILGVTSYALLRYTLYLLGMSYDMSELATNKNGKPYIKGNPFYFNMSHTKDAVACAVEWSEVGVDIQRRVTEYEKVCRRVCAALEMEKLKMSDAPAEYFTRLWALKESYVKCIGTGIWDNISDLDFADFAGERYSCRGYYFTVKSENDYCVSACSSEGYVEIKKVTIQEVLCEHQKSLGISARLNNSL